MESFTLIYMRERTSLLGQTKVFHWCSHTFWGFLGMWRWAGASLLSLICQFWLVSQGYFLGNLRIFVRKILNCPGIWAPGLLHGCQTSFIFEIPLQDIGMGYPVLPLHWRHLGSNATIALTSVWIERYHSIDVIYTLLPFSVAITGFFIASQSFVFQSSDFFHYE